MDVSVAQQSWPPMYNPDVIEMPYKAINAAYNLMNPFGNIADFFQSDGLASAFDRSG